MGSTVIRKPQQISSFIYYFFAFAEKQEETSKPVFCSVLVKWHLVYAAAIVTPIIVPILSKQEEEQRQQAKNGYWRNELDSLGIEPKQKKELNDKKELEDLSDNIKQAMFQDYKIAYSEDGNTHKEDAKSTVTVG
jgi:hypothetical protein